MLDGSNWVDRQLVDGNATTPATRFQREQGTGFFRKALGVIGIAILGVARVLYSAGAWAFQEATTISTTTGDLTLNPAANVAVPRKIAIKHSAPRVPFLENVANIFTNAETPFMQEIFAAKRSMVDNTATGFITVTVPNGHIFARIALDYYVHSNQHSRVVTGRVHVLVGRELDTNTVLNIAEVDTQLGLNSQGTETLTVTFANSGLTGAATASQTFTINVTIDSSVGGATTVIVFRAKLQSSSTALADGNYASMVAVSTT